MARQRKMQPMQIIVGRTQFSESHCKKYAHF